MNRYGIATLFDNYPDGYEIADSTTPLHLTHIDAFEVGINPVKFIDKLRRHLHDQSQFSVMPLEDAYYGPGKDIPVTVVELHPELKTFHNRLVSFLESEGAVFVNPNFIKEHYAPHISIYGSRRVRTGQPITINSISIGNKRSDIENPPNRVIATIPLH